MAATKVPSLVSAAWLASSLKSQSVKVVDASWYLPMMERDGRGEYTSKRVPGARFYDINQTDDTSDLPHMLPSAAWFASTCSKLGLSSADHIVCYDGKGVFSAPRFWWLLNTFGHSRASVLDGGLPAWERGGYPLETGPPPPAAEGEFDAVAPKTLETYYVSKAGLKAMLDNAAVPLQLVDARPGPRFEGAVAEPRAGLASGHMPGATSLPFGTLLDPASSTFLQASELRAAFAAGGVDVDDPAPIVTTCGSGVTAAILTLGLDQLGRGLSGGDGLYDGSWTEWGSDPEMPVETGPARKK